MTITEKAQEIIANVPGSSSAEPNGIRKNLLSDTAAAHIRALEDLQYENNDLRERVAGLLLQRQKQDAKLEITEETLAIVRRQLEYYQNFAVALATKVNDAQAIMQSAVEFARAAGDTSAKLQPISQADEERLKNLALALAPEKT